MLTSFLSLSLTCAAVVVRHISSSSGRNLPQCSRSLSFLDLIHDIRSARLSPCATVLSNGSLIFIFRVRFLDIVSRGSNEWAGDFVCPEDLRVDGMRLESLFMASSMSGRSVGKQPEMMPTEGSTDDQINTSLLAQLMSFVWTRRLMVMRR